ncbi:MAG: D-2-hydroxyacid dehydrogenase [Rhodospirillaceae bacterium]|nr:D-2-hydroxyacid dehydrogenase [Rhodospirillaceae bacterium]
MMPAIRSLSIALICLIGALIPARAEESVAEVVAALGLREGPAPVREMKGWEKPKKIVVLAEGAERIAWFQEAVKGVTLVPARNPKEALAQVGDADALVGFCQAEVVNAGVKLKWIHSQQAGVEDCLAVPKVRAGGMLLTNAQRLNGPNVAEHSMALLLTLTRQINVAISNQRDGIWDARPMRRVMDLDGKTMLVVGLGGVGTDLAKRANAFGMRVIATRNSSREGPPFVERVGLANELPAMIGEADVVVNVTPLTPETIGLFNAAMFARMKPTAYFINIGRGESVNTADLMAALKSGKLAGVGMDLVDPDPLPKDHPLWRIPNVVITPHTAGNSELKADRAWVLIRENLRRYVAGEKMYSVVDIRRGY